VSFTLDRFGYGQKVDISISKLKEQHEEELKKLQQQRRLKEGELARQIESIRRAAQSEAEGVQRRAEAEKADLKATISRLEVELMRVGLVEAVHKEPVWLIGLVTFRPTRTERKSSKINRNSMKPASPTKDASWRKLKRKQPRRDRGCKGPK
jgi:hypothetical protein